MFGVIFNWGFTNIRRWVIESTSKWMEDIWDIGLQAHKFYLYNTKNYANKISRREYVMM